MILWTQRTMHAAHRLYARVGFVRAPERDFAIEGRALEVHALCLERVIV